MTPPLDLMLPEGQEAKLTCTGTTDPDEVQNLKILWAKDGQVINYELAQRVFQNAIDNSLTISGTIYLDTAKYTCIATNGLDQSNASAQLMVQGAKLTSTGFPPNLEIREVREKSGEFKVVRKDCI